MPGQESIGFGNSAGSDLRSRGGGVLLDLFGARGPGDRGSYVALAQYPGKGKLRQRQIRPGRELLDLLHGPEGFTRKPALVQKGAHGAVGGAAIGWHGRVRQVLTGEDPLREAATRRSCEIEYLSHSDSRPFCGSRCRSEYCG